MPSPTAVCLGVAEIGALNEANGTVPDLACQIRQLIAAGQGMVPPMRGFHLEWYLHRLEFALDRVRYFVRAMGLDDFRRVRQLTDRSADLTPEWTLYHLTQHEAEHRGELAPIRGRAEASGRESWRSSYAPPTVSERSRSMAATPSETASTVEVLTRKANCSCAAFAVAAS
jgi:hypothetical protein